MNIKCNCNYKCIKLKVLNFRELMKKYKLKDDTMN